MHSGSHCNCSVRLLQWWRFAKNIISQANELPFFIEDSMDFILLANHYLLDLYVPVHADLFTNAPKAQRSKKSKILNFFLCCIGKFCRSGNIHSLENLIFCIIIPRLWTKLYTSFVQIAVDIKPMIVVLLSLVNVKYFISF